MVIKESNNLIYQKNPILPDGSGFYSPPPKSILEKFEHLDGKLVLHFKNRFIAFIRAKNLEGERELYKVTTKLLDFIGKSYQEILDFDF
jgi:hypothetical protein